MANVLLRINTDNKDVRKKNTFEYLAFETPNRIENETAGDTITITFLCDGTLSGETATLTLCKGDEDIATIVTGTTLSTGTNTQSYTLPSSTDGGNYYIKVEVTSKSPSWYFYSDIFSVGNYNKYYALETSTGAITFDMGLTSKSITLQWINDLITIGDVQEKVGDSLNYETSSTEISLKNDGTWNTILDDDDTRFLYGAEAELIDIDGFTSRRYRISEWNLQPGIINFSLSDRNGSFLEEPLNGLGLISESAYPDAPTESINKYIPMTYGNYRSGGMTVDLPKNTIRAYRVDKSSTEQYCIGKTSFPVVTFATGNYRVWLPDDTEVTSLCSNVLGSDDINYITYSGTDEEYLDVNFTVATIASPYTTLDILNKIDDLFTVYNFNTDALETYFGIDNFRYDDEYYIAKWHYAITENKTAKEALENLCRILGTEFYINENFEIVLKALDPANVESDKTFQEGEIKEFSFIGTDFDKMVNSVEYETAYQPKDSSFSLATKYINREGLRNWGIEKQLTTQYKGFPFERNNLGTNQFYRSHVPTKKTLMEFCEPTRNCQIKIDLDKLQLTTSTKLKPLDIIEFPITKNYRAITTENRKYQIRSISKGYAGDYAILNLRDVTFFDNFENKQTVLINSNDVDGSEVFWNDAVNGYNDITGDNVQNSTDYVKYGITSCKFQRAESSYQKIGGVDDNIKINFCNTSNTTDFNLEFWARFNALGSIEHLYNHYLDANNNIVVLKTAAEKIRFRITIAGVARVTLLTGIIVTANSWKHYNICRVGSDWGLYENETQLVYASNANSFDVNSFAYIGKDGTSTSFFDGYMDGFEINFYNKYGLAPVSGLTDTFTLLTNQQGFYRQT